MFRKISTFWVVLAALLITSAVPLGLMALNAIRTTAIGVESAQVDQLAARVKAHASTIDERLRAFQNATALAAAQAKVWLLNPQEYLSPEEQQGILQKYQRDSRGVYGLDVWYDSSYYPKYGDDRQSNVFLNRSTQLTPELEQAVAVTEKLNPIFESIRSSNIGTQWVYLTLAEGMIRLYPWHPNSYHEDWEPQTITFYTVADAEHNPEKKSVWTAPYNDYAGAGLMVTNSEPIYDRDTLTGVMSHDFRIEDLQREVLSFKVGEQGFAFMLDSQGNIIAHKDYAPENTPLGEELSIKLDEEDPEMAPVVEAMLSKNEGSCMVVDEFGNEWVVVYTRIQMTDWFLGLMQPRREIIEPALRITRQVEVGAIGLVVLVLVVSIGLARWISTPVIQLSGAARKIESSVDAMDASVGTGKDIAASTVDLFHIGGAREVSNLILVFSQMVNALQKRISELGSVYVMGQTITSSIDYEQTLGTVLSAVQRVVGFDAAEISILQDDTLTVEAWSGREGAENTRGHRRSVTQGLEGYIVHNRVPLLIPSVSATNLQEHLPPSTDAAVLNEIIDSGIGSFLGVPLLIGDQLIGILALTYRHETSCFTENDRRQLSRLAAQAAIAIENAIQVRKRETALREQIRELEIKIDQEKKARLVEEIVESDYFRKLQEQARQFRKRAKR